jgi:hypothetical protein
LLNDGDVVPSSLGELIGEVRPDDACSNDDDWLRQSHGFRARECQAKETNVKKKDNRTVRQEVRCPAAPERTGERGEQQITEEREESIQLNFDLKQKTPI